MPPPAPCLFSITTDCPSCLPSACATGRATLSATPPGGKGTISVMGRDGKSCAASGNDNDAAAATMSNGDHHTRMRRSLRHKLPAERHMTSSVAIVAFVTPVIACHWHETLSPVRFI